jgi:hypothetical protein
MKVHGCVELLWLFVVSLWTQMQLNSDNREWAVDLTSGQTNRFAVVGLLTP